MLLGEKPLYQIITITIFLHCSSLKTNYAKQSEKEEERRREILSIFFSFILLPLSLCLQQQALYSCHGFFRSIFLFLAEIWNDQSRAGRNRLDCLMLQM